MRLIVKRKDKGIVTEIRPKDNKDHAILLSLVGGGGFALLSLKADTEGSYLEAVPTNPETMEPWEIISCTTLSDSRLVAHGQETRTVGDSKDD